MATQVQPQTQPQRQTRTTPLLLAPGPTEVDPLVLATMSHPAESHFSAPFCTAFGDVLSMTRRLFVSADPAAQPFILGGSGSLGWDFVATNFLPQGSKVLTLSTGFFADGFAACLETYGLAVTKLDVPVGAAPDLRRVEEELASGAYSMVVATHVETSTAVLTRLQPIKEILDRVAPGTLFVVDAVASMVAEELRFDEWGIDVVVTGSQKAIGCPPGLSIIMVSGRALKAAEGREGKAITWYASLPRWLPIMRKYEAKEPSYFATPPTQVVRALKTSLELILATGMEETWRLHREKAALVKNAVAALGLRQLAEREQDQSNAVTAIWVPEGVTAKDLLARVLDKGVTLSAGMHQEVGTRYIRFGHMGYSVTGDEGHIETGIQVLSDTIMEMYNERREREVAQEESALSGSVLDSARQEVAVAQG